MLKPRGASWVDSQSAMAAAGDTWVSSCCSTRPSMALTRAVITSSARAWDPVSSTSNCALGLIHTCSAPCLVKARGSRDMRVSSRSSRTSLRPGLRPVVASMCLTCSSTLRLTTDPGTDFTSTIWRSSQWPPTTSTSGPWSSPRGSSQPADFSWDAPQGTKRAGCRASSSCACVIVHGDTIRYTITFLNTFHPLLLNPLPFDPVLSTQRPMVANRRRTRPLQIGV